MKIIIVESVSLIKNNANIFGLSIDDIQFYNVTKRESSWIFDTGSIQTISLTNAVFSHVTSSEEGDEAGSILFVNSLDLNSGFDLAINNVSITHSNISFIQFGTILNTPPTTKFLYLSNFSYSNSFINANNKLISTEGIEVDGDFNIVMSAITFNNVSFDTVGTLISFGHQLPNSVQVIGLVMTNIVAGILHVQSTNQQLTDLLTFVLIQNSVFDSINDQFSSLIIVEQGGRLNVTNSSFTNIYTFEEGAVVFAGPTGTETNFVHTLFQNNSAVTGALFHTESESVVR